jgi:hypothetical protein
MRDNWYDVAQICLNGHVINDSVKKYPQHNKKFCDKCGVATINNCPNCNTEIQEKRKGVKSLFFTNSLINCQLIKI